MKFLPPLFAAVLMTGCAPTPPPAKTDAPPLAVSLGTAAIADRRPFFEAGGVVRARVTAGIASRVMAPIVEVLARPGDRVRRGAPLVRLDARELQASTARASAAMQSARDSARAAEADTGAADAGLRMARLTHERMTALFAKRSATAQELDQAREALSSAEAQRASALAHASAANAARDQAEAAGQGAAIAASYAVLSAPFDGLVTERLADPGSMATPGAPILTLEDTTTFRLEVRLDEARAALVSVGDAIEITTADAAQRDGVWRAGRIVEIARLDAASHGFVVKVESTGDATARSGQFGRARFRGPAQRALTVPASALVRRGQLTFVFAVDAETVAHLRPVSIGALDADRVEVLAGVRDGERVVTNPPAALSDGSRVVGDRR